MLSACGGDGSDVVALENQGLYIMANQADAMESFRFIRRSRLQETCALFQSENNTFEYELSGMNVLNSGEILGVVGIEGQILNPGSEALIGQIYDDGRFEFSDLVRSFSDIPSGVQLEVEFDSIDNTMVIKPMGFDIPRELGFDFFPYFKKVSTSEFEELNTLLTIHCR